MRKIHFGVLLCALLAASLAFGQNASVSGTLADPSGAQVVGATLTALNAETGVVVPTTTNQAGVFVFPSLPPGKYTFTA